jgi:hypothetical protein
MKLLPGIRLIDNTGGDEPGKPRIALSAGTQPAATSRWRALYRDRAVVPCGPWRPPERAELALLAAEGRPAGRGTWISVVPVPQSYLHRSRSLHDASRNSQQTWEQANAYVSRHADMEAMVRFSAQFSTDQELAVLQKGVRANTPGLPTVTMDGGSGKLIGLHVDNWFNTPLVGRNESPNRVALNLGSQDRYLLFVNLSLMRIWELVHDVPRAGPAEPCLKADLLDRFWAEFPSYPVVRLRIGPGEAYVAPTENIAHDGSTLDMSTWDIYLTVLGYFAPSPDSRPEPAVSAASFEDR